MATGFHKSLFFGGLELFSFPLACFSGGGFPFHSVVQIQTDEGFSDQQKCGRRFVRGRWPAPH